MTNLPTDLFVKATDIDEEWYEMDKLAQGDAICDYLSDAYGFCLYGCDYAESNGQIHITHIEWDEEE